MPSFLGQIWGRTLEAWVEPPSSDQKQPAPLWQKIIAGIGACLALVTLAAGTLAGCAATEQPQPLTTPQFVSLTGCKL